MLIFWILAGYLAGSCPTGYLLAKYIKNVDIREFGSGNIGATNAGRLLGKKYAVFIALFDMLKGGIIVLLAAFCTHDPLTAAFSGAASVLGHNYPIWLGFKGGKGVATTYGVIFFFDFFNPLPSLLGGAVWYVVMKTSRYVSVGSICGLFAAAFLTLAFKMPKPYFFVSLFLAALSTYRHKDNLKRIAAGTETKVGEK